MKYTKLYEVNGFDLDPHYRLKKHLLAAYFQNTMACELDDLGFAAFHLQEEDKTWVLNEMRIDYLKPMPRWRAEITVETWTRKLSGIRLYRDYRALDPDGDVVALGTTSVLVIDEKTRRPQKLGDIADALALMDDEVFPGFRFGPVEFDEAAVSFRLSGTVRTFDIDFNHHLNNIRYIAAAIEPIPYPYRQQHTLSSFRIKYTQESYLHDELVAECYGDNNRFSHRIRREKDGAVMCTMESEWAPGEE